ncbi:ABC transporter, ATP-binding protein (fragment) [Xanthomonas citri pv. fuscans]
MGVDDARQRRVQVVAFALACRPVLCRDCLIFSLDALKLAREAAVRGRAGPATATATARHDA